ncbi:MAG: hypothetical protein INF43_05575 [Alphaproteobacteria bacterium]|nr:hypothetical protein [Alphaproteobacteria bacterium]
MGAAVLYNHIGAHMEILWFERAINIANRHLGKETKLTDWSVDSVDPWSAELIISSEEFNKGYVLRIGFDIEFKQFSVYLRHYHYEGTQRVLSESVKLY